jgi:hypothetical protein
MQSSFIGLGSGLAFAILLVYAGLSSDRNQFPVLERGVYYHHRFACGARGHLLDVVFDANDA